MVPSGVQMSPVNKVIFEYIYLVLDCNTLAYLKDKSTCVYQTKNLCKHVKQIFNFLFSDGSKITQRN